MVLFLYGCSEVRERRERGISECGKCHSVISDPEDPPTLYEYYCREEVAPYFCERYGILKPKLGAHSSHFKMGLICKDCHKVPQDLRDPDHIDPEGYPPEVEISSELAKREGLSPSWDSSRCKSVYCHGVTLQGGREPEPLWSEFQRMEPFSCGSCHGIPPLDKSHASLYGDCGICHQVFQGKGVGKGRHIDGQVAMKDLKSCNSCHGKGVDGAPPPDLHGSYSTKSTGVGAHQSHFSSRIARLNGCSECHSHIKQRESKSNLPECIDSDLGREVVFDLRARGYEAKLGSLWTGERCTNIYCHGATLRGGKVREPVWTQVDGSQARCGSCHGLPPPLPHPIFGDCAKCHRGTMSPKDSEAILNLELHINGKVDVTP